MTLAEFENAVAADIEYALATLSKDDVIASLELLIKEVRRGVYGSSENAPVSVYPSFAKALAEADSDGYIKIQKPTGTPVPDIIASTYPWIMTPCLICHHDFATCAGPKASFCSAYCAVKGERIAIDKRAKGFATCSACVYPNRCAVLDKCEDSSAVEERRA